MATVTGAGRSWPELQPNSDSKLQPLIQQRQVVYANPYQKIHHVIADFGNFTKEYFVNDYGGRAGMVAVRQGKILLVRQYRLLIDRISWEIPGGSVDEGETPIQAAARECLEETGVRCLNLQPLLSYHMAVDTLNNPTSLFYSHEIAEIIEPQHVDIQEVSSWEWLPLDQCLEMIFTGQILDSFSIIALLAYYYNEILS